MKKQFLFVLVAAAVIMAAFNAEALTFNPFKRAGRVRATTLILTDNSWESRLLAEVALYYSKQPVLILSRDLDASYQIFYLPSGKAATPVNVDEFMNIVDYVNPKRIVVLGGDDYVPRKFIDLARSKYSVMILDSDDWSRNAATLGELLKYDKLALSYNHFKANADAVNK